MKKAIQAVAFVGVLGFSGLAMAQDDSGTTTYDFEDDLVTGDLVRPDGDGIFGKVAGKRTTLIRIREHFIPEMLKSVEDL